MKFPFLTTSILFSLSLVRSALALDVGLKVSSEESWKNWGDYILGQDLKSGLEALGYSVLPTYAYNYYPEEALNSKTDIYMHGFIPFNPPKDNKKINVLYLYYPLETSNMDKFQNINKSKEEEHWMSLQTELWDYDLIAVSSPTYQKEIAKWGIPTIFAPQFSNTDKFFYEYDETIAYDILFVGRPGYRRISAEWAIESGYDVALFGSGWYGKAPDNMIKGAYIDNDILHKYYASAKIVLNDTREDMKQAGFISNRVFDVTASGGFLISDYMPEIEMFYGDSIPMFKTKEELKELLDFYLAHPEERQKKAKQAQEITLKNFSSKVVAQNIMTAVKEIRKKKLDKNSAHLDMNKLIIKSPWSSDMTGIGDYWLGLDLEKGFLKSGYEVKNYYFNNMYKQDDFYKNAGNLLYLQFKFNHIEQEDENKNKIMYLYFPTEIPNLHKFKNTEDNFVYNTHASLNNDLAYFDVIATPAKKLVQDLLDNGYNAVFMPQFTNPDKFRYEPDDNLQTDLLFVGSPWYERLSVSYALKYGYDISVYGLNWYDKIPHQYIKGGYIDNNNLNRYYASAKIVLSDHPDDLAEMGLVINRLYDASAAGAFIISEYSPYIEEIFGDAIPMYKNDKEFKELVDFYLANPLKRQEKANKAKEITLREFTNTAVAQKLKQIFIDLSKEKQ